MSDLSFLSVYSKNWIDDYLEKEFHGASKFWNKETARQFQTVDIETLLFDEYFLNGKSWIYPGIADVIFEIHEEMKKRPLQLIAIAGGIGCLPAYAPVKTIKGYATIGETSIGDKILGVKGDIAEECNVINKTYSGKKEVFRIYCKDGNYIDATKEHIFPIRRRFYIKKSDKIECVEQIEELSVESILKYIETFTTIEFIQINSEYCRAIDYVSLGVMDTYDITIDNDSHTFLAYNDFLCKNSGKTSGILAIMNWLSWYKFTCKFKEDSQMVCPQEFYGLKPTSKVAFIALSKTLDKSKQITFSEMKSAFVSQFNKDYFPINERKKSQIEIESNNTVVFPNTATEAANAGWSIFSFCMDEISFLDIIDSSARSRGQAEDVYDQAQAAYNSAYGRMFSRFGRDGLGVITSSVNFDEDFLMKKMRQIYTGTAVEPAAENCYMKILIPWKVNADKWNTSKKFFYFDTENYKIVKEKKEVAALNKYFIESSLEDIVFGNTDNDPNDQILKDVRTGKITVD